LVAVNLTASGCCASAIRGETRNGKVDAFLWRVLIVAGKWSDSSPAWTEEMKEELEVTSVDDGTFWMALDDFATYFDEVSVCYVHEGWRHFSFHGCFSLQIEQLIMAQVKCWKAVMALVSVLLSSRPPMSISLSISWISGYASLMTRPRMLILALRSLM
jgi:hypothetical protein